MPQDTNYIQAKLIEAARAAIENSTLNVGPAEWREHALCLVNDFWTTIEVYLSENAAENEE